MRFYQDNLDARKINNTLNNDICKKLIENSMARKRGQMYTVTNKDKKLTAAIFCAWDDNVSYHLLTTRSQEAGSGDISALIWKAMLDASNRGLIFDLGGLAGSGSAFFYSGFGANIRPRYVVTKASLPVQLAFMLLKSDAEYQYYI
jgi:lipid II:glycine glycyltransferase (peptidoglycan interpeptide bridge formation enzyme)